jgi:hypothetical protein
MSSYQNTGNTLEHLVYSSNNHDQWQMRLGVCGRNDFLVWFFHACILSLFRRRRFAGHFVFEVSPSSASKTPAQDRCSASGHYKLSITVGKASWGGTNSFLGPEVRSVAQTAHLIASMTPSNWIDGVPITTHNNLQALWREHQCRGNSY